MNGTFKKDSDPNSNNKEKNDDIRKNQRKEINLFAKDEYDHSSNAN